jgi:Holliday junction resolvase RusA-like endonuclease
MTCDTTQDKIEPLKGKIILPYPPSVNTAYGQSKGRRRFKSKKYVNWLAKCPKLFASKINHEVEITYKVYFPDNRIRDGQNILKVCLDYLVSSGVIVDDNWKIVKGERWIACGIDKQNPRVEIEIIG